jgi:hypothetical protein
MRRGAVDTRHTAPDSPCRLTSTAGRIKPTLIRRVSPSGIAAMELLGVTACV